MITGSCHCGAVKQEIDADIPEKLTSCNCSICRRHGSLFAYFPPEKVKITYAPDAVRKYSWGDKGLAFVSCATCNCLSHWESLDPNFTDRMGVSARLFDNIDISKIRVRRFDGADTWKFLD